MKKTLSIILTILLVVSLLPSGIFGAVVSADDEYKEYFYEGDYTYTVKDGKATIEYFSGEVSGNYTVPSKLGGYDVTCIGDSVFSFTEGLTSVTIPNTVTSIGEFAFSECVNLSKITFPSNIKEVGNGAFYNTAWEENQPDGIIYINKVAYKCKGECSGNVVIKAGTTSISSRAFAYCGLTSVSIPDSVTNIGEEAFEFCEITEITIPKNVTSIGVGAFAYCYYLESISVAVGNKNYVSKNNCLIDINSKTLIAGCMNSTIPSDGSVTSIGDYAFAGCYDLENIAIPNTIKTIGDIAFSNCSGLTSITIPNSVTSIGWYAFSDCFNLETITLGNGLKSIGDEAFYDCLIKSITIPKSVTNIGTGVFSGCDELNIITVEKGNSVYHSNGNCIIETAAKRLIAGCKNSTIPADGSVTEIGVSAFYNLNGLTSIIIPNGVTIIEMSAFALCEDLTSVTIPKSVVTIGDWVFDFCDGLKDVFYTGSQTDKSKIEIDEVCNETLMNATWHYNSQPDSGSDPEPDVGSDITIGLVSGNEKISATDALLILQAVVGKIEFTAEQKQAADVNGDGEITATDALTILHFVVGKITKFPVEA